MSAPEMDLDWMLADLTRAVPETRHVVVLSADGLTLARHATEDEAADRIAAACAGLQSLAAAVASMFPRGDHRMRLLVIEAGGGFFYLMAAGPGAYLAVLADEGVDPGLMGQQMRDLVARLGEHLTSAPLTGFATGLPEGGTEGLSDLSDDEAEAAVST